mgnify:CR=1 FL=1
MKYSYKTKGTCSTQIEFDLTDGILRDVQFTNGCNGNLKAIARLVEGLPADQVAEKLTGIQCGFKDTSCGDQLSKALWEALSAAQKEAV